jgi:hypothetical protein
MEKNRYKVKLNNIDKIEQLLQETYDLANQQTNKIQEEINKIANTTVINELDIEGKEKYAKIMSNYISLQQKAIQQKFDISKLMAEVMKHNGDVDSALKDSKKTGSTLDISKLQELAKNANTQSNNTTEQYQLKR